MKILIAGAGIGGLTAALALERQGHDVKVYESAPLIQPVGAGIWLAPNGQEVLRRIDDRVLHAVQSTGLLLDEAVITDIRGRVLSRINARAFQNRYATPAVLAVRRSELHRVLHDSVMPGTVRFGHRVERYETGPGAGVRIHFEDGQQTTGDLLIAADGIHSPVRTQLFGARRLRYSGQTCWRGLATMRQPAEWTGKGVEIWADEAGLRAGFSQVSPEQVYYYVTALAPAGQSGICEADLHRHLDRLPAVVREFVDATPPGQIIRSDLNDLKPLRHWTSGPVALLGDAAHAALPNLGQGANQAMESAIALAHCLRGSTPHNAREALLRYQNSRIKKATYVINTSWRIGQLINWRDSWARRARNTIMSRIPESASQRQFHRIFDVPADWSVLSDH